MKPPSGADEGAGRAEEGAPAPAPGSASPARTTHASMLDRSRADCVGEVVALRLMRPSALRRGVGRDRRRLRDHFRHAGIELQHRGHGRQAASAIAAWPSALGCTAPP